MNLPSQSLTTDFPLLSTNTAFGVGDVVVAGEVIEVVTSGVVVVSAQGYSSQGHPAGQLS